MKGPEGMRLPWIRISFVNHILRTLPEALEVTIGQSKRMSRLYSSERDGLKTRSSSRFGIKDVIVKTDQVWWREEQIVVFECFGKHEAFLDIFKRRQILMYVVYVGKADTKDSPA